ncbi:MAG: mevalonate kinase [Anaerolineae bacterium]
MTVGTAPGKAILLGEHAVVYGRPAIAVPVNQVQARVQVDDAPPGKGITIVAAELRRTILPADISEHDRSAAALARTVGNTLEALGRPPSLDLRITLTSTIPIGRGLGSGAAVATALVRALAAHLGCELTAQEVSDLVYRTETLHHGTPSGIDNTVIAFGKPLYFVRGEQAEVFSPGSPLWLVIADTGVSASTRRVVAAVRQRWQAEREAYESRFDAIGALVKRARDAIRSSDLLLLGQLMDENQSLLAEIGVSSPRLERLIAAARGAGALGAKLSGSGRGGNMIALVEQQGASAVADALLTVGARKVITTCVS